MTTAIRPAATLSDWQKFSKDVYGPSNRKYFTVEELMTNVERFTMRGLKGIRKNDTAKIQKNLLTAMSWYLSMLNMWDIDIDDEVWKRFPHVCSYCGSCPCACKVEKVQMRVEPKVSGKERPKTLAGFQAMFNEIYPPGVRSVEHAGIHLAEEVGELSEAILRFRGSRAEKDFQNIPLEAADLFSCFMGVFNSMKVSVEDELVRLFPNGCHACTKTPCICDYQYVMRYES